MAVTFVAQGGIVANATTVTLALVAPSLLANDIMIAVVLSKDNQVVSAPDGTWTSIVALNNTANQRISIFWKRAASGDSGATFNFTKPTDNNLLFCGVISAWRGCVTSGSPLDATAASTSANASGDNVSYATFDPAAACHVVAIGVYNNDLTTAGSISGTNPTLANRWDLETATGSDGSIFGYSGDSDGAATGARSHSTTSTADDVSIGVLFGLVAQSVTNVDADAIASTSSVPQPSIDPTVTASAAGSTSSVSQPTINPTIDPSTITSTSSVPNPTVDTGTNIDPPAIGPTNSVPNPTIVYLVDPGAVGPSGSVPSPTVDVVIAASAVASSGSVPAPVLASTIEAPALASTSSMPTPIVEVALTSSAVASASSVPAPTINPTVGVGAIGPSATVPQPSLTEETEILPPAIGPASSVPSPALETAIAASLLAAASLMLSPTIDPTITPPVITSAASVPSPTVEDGLTPPASQTPVLDATFSSPRCAANFTQGKAGAAEG